MPALSEERSLSIQLRRKWHSLAMRLRSCAATVNETAIAHSWLFFETAIVALPAGDNAHLGVHAMSQSCFWVTGQLFWALA